jgi:hypothetical protein
MEFNGCYGKSMVAILVTGCYKKSMGAIVRLWLLWKIDGFYDKALGVKKSVVAL